MDDFKAPESAYFPIPTGDVPCETLKKATGLSPLALNLWDAMESPLIPEGWAMALKGFLGRLSNGTWISRGSCPHFLHNDDKTRLI